MKTKEMNQEAKEALLDLVQKMNKDSQAKKKQADDLLATAKILENSTKVK